MMRQVADGVWQLTMGRGISYAYLLVGDQLTLVDTGVRGGASVVLDALARLGRDPGDITTIAITHHHSDHVGALASLQRKTGATTYASAAEAEIVRGDRPVPHLVSTSWRWRVLLGVTELIGATNFELARVDHLVGDGDPVGASGLTAVSTPGHTMGHVAFMHHDSGTLFAGDAAALASGGLRMPIGYHDESPEDTVRSIQKLAGLAPGTACFGHSGSIEQGAAKALREFAEKAAAQ